MDVVRPTDRGARSGGLVQRSSWWSWALALGLLAACGGGDTSGASSPPPPSPSRAAVALPEPTSTGADVYPAGTVLHELRRDGRFSTFVAIVETGQVGRALEFWSRSDITVTLIAPTDAAFSDLDPVLLEALIEHEVLGRVIMNHVVSVTATAEELAAQDDPVQTLGVALDVQRDGETTVVSGVPIVEADIRVEPAMIHIVEQLILPCDDAYLADVVGQPYVDHCTG